MYPKTSLAFFSVIVPTYNNEKEIRKCIDSVLKQVYENFELIIVDDGSTDSTPYICDHYACYDNRIRVIHKKHEGVAAARNVGLFSATGKYVCYVDADDWISERLLAEASYILEADESPDIFIFGIEMIMEDEQNELYPCFVEPGLYSKSRLRCEIYPRMMRIRETSSWMQVVSSYLVDKVISRDLLIQHYCRDTSLFIGEDSVCAYECIYFASQIYFSTQILYYYNRKSESSMHKKYHKNMFSNYIKVMQYLQIYLGRNGGKEILVQINKVVYSGLAHAVKQELQFGFSICKASSHLKKEIGQVKQFPICGLKGLSFSEKIFILLLSCRLQFIILLAKKILNYLSIKKRCINGRKKEKD